MATEWTNVQNWKQATLFKLESGEIFAVIVDPMGISAENRTFASTVEAKEFFNSADGWKSKEAK